MIPNFLAWGTACWITLRCCDSGESPVVPVTLLPGCWAVLTNPEPAGSVIPAKITGLSPLAVLANDKAAGVAIPMVRAVFSLANFL